MEWQNRLGLLAFVVIALAEVGCDGILGSGSVVDQCGVCGGDGATCRVISGIFTRTRLRQYGYHHVTTLPAGACNVNITELARSRNYLALMTADGGNIVNGDRQLQSAGQFSGAGTTFDYRRRSGLWCPGACIFADGPLTQPVNVQILYYDRNPGIMYHFTVPQDTAKAVMNAANHTHTHTPHHNDNNDQQAADQRRTPLRRGHNDDDDDDNASGGAEAARHGKRRRNRTRPSSSSSSSSSAQSRRGKRKHSAAKGKLASLSEPPSDVPYDSTPSSLRDPSPPFLPRENPSSAGDKVNPPRRRHPGRSSSSSGSRREELSPGRGRPLRRRPSPPSQVHGQSPSSSSSSPGSQGESPLQPGPSVIPNVASAPRYVPPEAVVEGGGDDDDDGDEEEEGAPIQYRHYYHVDSDDYRRHSRRRGGGGSFAALNSRAQWLSRNELVAGGGRGGVGVGAGAEALSRPNLIPATRRTAQGRWGARGDVISNDVNAVGDVPLAVPASGYFVWTISGFSPCSRPCGGGSQQTVVVCMKSDTRVVVMAENCDLNARPSPTTVECNSQPCDPQWTEEEWSACSVTCGHGVMTRRVECRQRISPTLHLSVSADRCSDPKPPVTQFCRQPPCFRWTTSNWTTCSTNCGLGERTRRAWCVGGEGDEVEASRCSQDRPRTRVLCDMGSCAKGWYYTRWSKQCSPQCGTKTYKTRQVHCAAEDGGPLPGDKCPAHEKPRARKSCGVASPCGGKWFSGPWSECNATCGEAWRTREVVCMKKHGRRLWGVVGKENCLRKERPVSRDMCSDLPSCLPEWYMTHWSECSKSCGTGAKTREVKCLDSSLQPSMDCRAKRRPQERRPCNTQSCHNHTLPLPNDYDKRPQKPVVQEASPRSYQESTSPNTSFQHYHRSGARPPQAMALQASAPAEISVKEDVRSALGDDAAHDRHNHHRPSHQSHHRRRHHQHHHQVTSADTPDPTMGVSDTPKQTLAADSNGRQTPTATTPTTTTTTTTKVSEQQTPPTTTPTTSGPGDSQCTDKPNGRWCMFVSQARLCGYHHYKKRCCQTCSKYHH